MTRLSHSPNPISRSVGVRRNGNSRASAVWTHLARSLDQIRVGLKRRLTWSATLAGLCPTECVQGLIAGALDALLDVPFRFAVPDEYYCADLILP